MMATKTTGLPPPVANKKAHSTVTVVVSTVFIRMGQYWSNPVLRSIISITKLIIDRKMATVLRVAAMATGINIFSPFEGAGRGGPHK